MIRVELADCRVYGQYLRGDERAVAGPFRLVLRVEKGFSQIQVLRRCPLQTDIRAPPSTLELVEPIIETTRDVVVGPGNIRLIVRFVADEIVFLIQFAICNVHQGAELSPRSLPAIG